MLFWIIYGVGYVVSYLVLKWVSTPGYTKADRLTGLFFSLFSWAIIFVFVLFYIFGSIDNWSSGKGSKPAKW